MEMSENQKKIIDKFHKEYFANALTMTPGEVQAYSAGIKLVSELNRELFELYELEVQELEQESLEAMTPDEFNDFMRKKME